MSFDSHQAKESNIFSLRDHFCSENMFSSTPHDFLKDPAMMQHLMLFRDSESEEVVSVADEVSGVAEDLDLGYDTNSELSSPMSAISHWGEASTPVSAVGSCTEESLFAEFEEESRNSLISILDDDNSDHWNKSLTSPTNATTPSVNGSTPDLSPRSPLVGQVPSITAAPVDFSTALQVHNVLQSRSEVTEGTTVLALAAKPVRKRAATSLSTCGLTPRKRLKTFPSLLQNLPEKQNGAELHIDVQPEKHHRARYRTEGSRGSVKDDSGDCYPKLRLEGIDQPVTLQVFVGIDQGKIRPHGYYQACKVTGRNTTPCEEKDIDGTTVLEVPWEPTDGKMELSVDCIGILKLRNADVEQRIGQIRSKRKSTCVRLVFRVHVPTSDESFYTLQAISRSITCTQPLGHPEILKKSLTQCSVAGGEELFIIGKNFTSKASTEVKLRQLDDSGKVTWEGDCEIDKSLFQNNHIVCKIPPYPNQNAKTPITVYLVVVGKPNQSSELEAHPIDYVPQPGALSIHVPSVNSDTTQDATFTNNAATTLQQTVVPSTLTSPVVPQVSVVNEEPIVHQIQEQSLPSLAVNDEFSLALQMLAGVYVRNRDMYNNLLMQTQTSDQSHGLSLNNSLQGQMWKGGKVGDEQLGRPDCAVKRVFQALTEGCPVVKSTKTDSQAHSKTKPVVTATASDAGIGTICDTTDQIFSVADIVADIYETIVLPDITECHVLDDVLDVLNNN